MKDNKIKNNSIMNNPVITSINEFKPNVLYKVLSVKNNNDNVSPFVKDDKLMRLGDSNKLMHIMNKSIICIVDDYKDYLKYAVNLEFIPDSLHYSNGKTKTFVDIKEEYSNKLIFD